MTQEEISEIISLYSNGYSVTDTADHIGCSDAEVVAVLLPLEPSLQLANKE